MHSVTECTNRSALADFFLIYNAGRAWLHRGEERLRRMQQATVIHAFYLTSAGIARGQQHIVVLSTSDDIRPTQRIDLA